MLACCRAPIAALLLLCHLLTFVSGELFHHFLCRHHSDSKGVVEIVNPPTCHCDHSSCHRRESTKADQASNDSLLQASIVSGEPTGDEHSPCHFYRFHSSTVLALAPTISWEASLCQRELQSLDLLSVRDFRTSTFWARGPPAIALS
ncbi:MAG: hypothetical protein RLY14_3001 [Planctomycetota bacterium]